MKAAILTDLTRCIGCGGCAVICKQTNKLPGRIGKKLDAYNWTVVERRSRYFVRRQCMHCLEPTCASVCPVGALHKTEIGAVAYDSYKCIGCRYCIMACPFDIPKYQWDSPIPIVGKCIMCYEKRLKQGKQPACTEVCPAGATVFGDRQKLIAEAKRRIHENPDRYHHKIYGEKEAGGTSVMYLSAVPFSTLGFKRGLRYESYPELTWNILEKLPPVIGTAGVTLFGLMWIINRRIEMRHKLAAEKGKKE